MNLLEFSFVWTFEMEAMSGDGDSGGDDDEDDDDDKDGDNLWRILSIKTLIGVNGFSKVTVIT